MALITPDHTVTPRTYQTRFVGDTVSAITVWNNEADEFVTTNLPRTIYWKHNGEFTIRGQRPEDSLSLAVGSSIVAVFYFDGRIESAKDAYEHVSTLD